MALLAFLYRNREAKQSQMQMNSGLERLEFYSKLKNHKTQLNLKSVHAKPSPPTPGTRADKYPIDTENAMVSATEADI